eukprot:1040070-Pelagomonas_calceolata.AAC.5
MSAAIRFWLGAELLSYGTLRGKRKAAQIWGRIEGSGIKLILRLPAAAGAQPSGQGGIKSGRLCTQKGQQKGAWEMNISC